MSKANQLREALRAKNNRMPYADALKIVGTRSNMQHMLTIGEIEVVDDDDGKFITLDPDFKTKRDLPIRRKSKRAQGSKKKHTKAPRVARPFKALAEKHAPESRTEALARIALQNLIASTEGLAAIVRDQVDGIDNNPALRSQIEASERAAQLARLV